MPSALEPNQGVRRLRAQPVLRNAMIHEQLELWRPTFLMIHGARQMPPRKHLFRERLLKGVAAEAKNYCSRVHILKKRSTDRAERLTKYERAQAASSVFPSSLEDARQSGNLGRVNIIR